MPLFYLRRLTAVERSPQANRHLAYYLAFTAGAVNAGGFLAVQQYTSHMSGILSAMADHLALGAMAVFLQGLAALLSFMLGAATSAVLVNFGRRARLASEFALPLLLEAMLLLAFGLLGGNLEPFRWLAVPITVVLLCYIMGLQNAIITKMSRSEIRTTHVTGMVTDIGIELGKLFYWNVSRGADPAHFVRADRNKLRVLGMLVGLFFAGGVAGALSFAHFGFVSTVPLALLLTLLAAVPVIDDIQGYWRHH
ncbi:MAG: YoaK family protein [Pigmentiphaga sp.]|nr:YoaK family protein [Pigmentiphaga sp.]